MSENVHRIEDARKRTDREETLADFAGLLGVPKIARIVQRGRDPQLAHYTIEFDDGRHARIGKIDVLCSQTRLARALAVTLSYHPPPVPRDPWAYAVIALVNDGLEVEDDEGDDFKSSVREWLIPYVGRRGSTDRENAVKDRQPYIDADYVHVALEPFATYVRRNYSEQVKLADLRDALKDLGFIRRAINYTERGKRSSASYFIGPTDLLDAEDGLL